MMVKKTFLLTIITVCICTIGYGPAQAEYPDRAIEAIVQYKAGGATDTAARLMAEFLEKELGQPVVILNKPGGAGAVAGNLLYKRKPDGYTLGMFNTNQPTPEYVMKPERFIYKSKDIQAAAQWSGYAPAIFVKYDAPWKTLDEFVDHAKKNPQKLKWGHSGRGNLWWTIGTTFSKVAKIQMLDVPFQGDGPNMSALLGGHVDMSILTCGARAIGQIKANKIRPLAITVPQRHHLVPDVANVDELGYALGIPAPYLGTFVRSGTPKDIVSKLSEAIGKVTENPAYKEKLGKLGMPIWYRKTEDFSKLVQEFGQVQFKLLKELGVLK